VLQALVGIDPDCHPYRAELGITLADLGDHPAALAALDDAIARRGAPTASDWYEFHRARARVRLAHVPAPDPRTAALIRDDLAVAWRQPGFRAHVDQVLADPDDPEHRLLDRIRPYLPAPEETGALPASEQPHHTQR
jgi:hypothetical protein